MFSCFLFGCSTHFSMGSCQGEMTFFADNTRHKFDGQMKIMSKKLVFLCKHIRPFSNDIHKFVNGQALTMQQNQLERLFLFFLFKCASYFNAVVSVTGSVHTNQLTNPKRHRTKLLASTSFAQSK